ncbi:hypothetical protein [Streptomyces sp. NPDC047706]|uniref:hypothetical protein n=1 Tax=Streptomyces sp. NPDC047706 TaxID=3365486 RepID=UPI003715A485
MPRIKLATWYGDKAPGEELDVDDVTLKALRRDGLVAEVTGYEDGGRLEPGTSEVTNTTDQPEQVVPASPPETGGKRR